jgi:hypothetical protein
MQIVVNLESRGGVSAVPFCRGLDNDREEDRADKPLGAEYPRNFSAQTKEKSNVGERLWD